MPTMLWFPEVMEPAENWEKWLQNSENKILDYRNVWLLNPRNFGDSDHHNSFDLEEVANDVNRFLDENQLTAVTVGGHGYGAKVASAFGSYFYDRTSGVICLEGGPLDHTYYESWEEVKNAINMCAKIKLENASVNDVYKKIDLAIEHPKWRAILKQNLIEGKSSLQWRFNMEQLAIDVNKQRSDIASWSSRYGLYPGRSFVLFAEFSRWVFLNTNTIPFYNFFPKLEGRFPSNNFNFVQTPDDPLSKFKNI
jgi:pimeloyl-ACP methyl ester carboxylesterase